MITHIEIDGFKSLQKVSLDLGGLNVFVGANASGKSNFFDAMRVLQGIGYGFTINEIFNGKPKSANSEVWDGIRGGSGNAPFQNWKSHTTGFAGLVRFIVKLKSPKFQAELGYEIAISPHDAVVWEEGLSFGDTLIFHTASHGDRNSPSGYDLSRPALQQVLTSREFAYNPSGELVELCSQLLSDSQLMDPTPAVLRGYSSTPLVRRMGERGENFAGLVGSILDSKREADAYVSWLKQLTPSEFDEVGILRGALQEPLFAVRKGGHWIPAPLLSDGTLRFASMAAAFFQPDMPQMLLIEEIENGIHPSRLRLLIELLKSRSTAGVPQVMATSHSPLLLAWLNEEDYRTTFLCNRDEETGASIITPLASIPRFTELARKQPVADLFAEGWLETAL